MPSFNATACTTYTDNSLWTDGFWYETLAKKKMWRNGGEESCWMMRGTLPLHAFCATLGHITRRQPATTHAHKMHKSHTLFFVLYVLDSRAGRMQNTNLTVLSLGVNVFTFRYTFLLFGQGEGGGSWTFSGIENAPQKTNLIQPGANKTGQTMIYQDSKHVFSKKQLMYRIE